MAAAWRMAIAHLLSQQKKAFLEFRAMRKSFEDARKRRRDAHKQAIDIWGGLAQESPKGPVLQRFVCTQTAGDRLAAILEENPRGLLVAREEFNGWFASFLRARVTTGGRDPSLWLEMHRAGSFYFERTCGDRGVSFIPRAAGSLAAMLRRES